MDGNVVWQFGKTGQWGGDLAHLNGPHNADRLPNGNTIVADSLNHRILEVDSTGAHVVWLHQGDLWWPRDADRLDNGNTLINDSLNYRVLEVTRKGDTVWTYSVNQLSYASDRLASANTLINLWCGIIEVDPSGVVVWTYPIVYETEVVQGYLVTAPNGNDLWTRIIQPRAALYPGQTFPAVISVPGALDAGETGDLQVAASGLVEFHFNAEGRGVLHPSEGTEDYNGLVHQDDLKAVIEFAQTRANVVQDNVGVLADDYGITMAAGCLGRYAALPVKYLIDQEGPSDDFATSLEPWSLDADPSNDRHEEAYAVFGHWSTYRDPSPENAVWWSQREALAYIGLIRCQYFRVQAEWDHALPPNGDWPGFDFPPTWYQCKHAVDLLNAATEGEAAWTGSNGWPFDNPPNTTYDYDNPPTYYSHTMADHPGELQRLVLKMADMPAVPPIPDCNGNSVPDDRDISTGSSLDCDQNDIPDECECPGDFNEDGFRDFTDFNVFAAAYGSQVGQPNYDLNADLNCDEVVNFTDWAMFADRYGQPCQ
jgi:hypothetical protein